MRTKLAALWLVGCTVDFREGRPEPPEEEPWDNVAPTLRVVSPGEIVVGDELLFAGQDFIDPKHGQARARFLGWFTNDQGETTEVDLGLVPEWRGAGELRWRMEPNVVFEPSGERIGTFAGEVAIVNEPFDTEHYDTLESEGLAVQIEVGPSILLRTLRPEDSSCGLVVSATLEGAPLELVAEAIGIEPGTPERPLVATYQFIAPQFVVMFEGDMVGDRPLDENPTPEELIGQQGAQAFEQRIEDGTTRLTLAARWRTRVSVGGETRYVGMFRVGALAQPANEQESIFNLLAEDAEGRVARRAVRLVARRIAWLSYDGNQVLAERLQPIRVTACIPGATPVTEAQYSETSAEVRTRSMSFNWNMSVADSLGFSANLGLPPWNPFFFNVGVNYNRTWSEGFGMDVAASVSTEMSQIQGISGQIYPGEYGAFYRQTERLERLGVVSGSNECGVVGTLGEALLTDWAWAAELAKGTSCPPATGLPPAEVLK